MMQPWQRWLLNSLTLIVGATGVVYLWMKYFLTNPGPFALVNHPWQPAMLKIHLLASPALILVFGMLWSSHVSRKLGTGQPYNRRSGLVSLWSFLIMAGSGYLLQVLTSQSVQTVVMVLHVGSGSLFLAAFSAHFVLSLRSSLTRRRARLRSAA